MADLNAGLAWFVSPERAEGWPAATQAGARLERAPTVVIAWSPTATRDAEATVTATRMTRERWIAAIKEKFDRSGGAPRALASPPDAFEDGVTLSGLGQLAADHGADVIVLFGLETAKRQYHAFEPAASAGAADVANVVEVVTLAKTVGVTPSGVPLFADSQKGFASAKTHVRTEEELEETSQRVAVDAVAAAVVRRLNEISPGKGSE